MADVHPRHFRKQLSIQGDFLQDYSRVLDYWEERREYRHDVAARDIRTNHLRDMIDFETSAV